MEEQDWEEIEIPNKRLEELEQYVIVDKQTQELWTEYIYSAIRSAKSSFLHASNRYDRDLRKWVKTRFDDQNKYEIVKVKLVRCE